MSDFTDSEYLKASQYKDSGNYGARVLFHERYKTNPYDSHKWCFDHMLERLPAQAHILELGGGRADIWIKNLDRIPAGWQIVFSDFSPGMVEDTQARLGEDKAKFAAFKVIDAESIPYDDHTFDGVVANLMLYHVPDRPKALAEIRRVLKPDGKCFAMTLGENHMQGFYDWVRAVVPALNFGLKHTDNPFTLENGVDQLKAHFADVQALHYEDSLAITSLDLVVEYVASLAENLDESNLATLKTIIQKTLAEQGQITSNKDIGLFIAQG